MNSDFKYPLPKHDDEVHSGNSPRTFNDSGFLLIFLFFELVT